MDHVAIDVGGRESQICRFSPEGEILEERRWRTSGLRDYLAGLPPSRVILETCAEAFVIADDARELGHDPRVVPATLSRQLGVGARKIKNDRRDARALGSVSCKIELPSVHIPTKQSRELNSFCGMRDALVATRTALVNTIKGYVRGRVFSLRLKSTPEGLPKGARMLYGRQNLAVPIFLERQLRALEAMNQLIKEADKELSQRTQEDERCRRLMTVPGVGPVTALRFVATVDRVERFPNAHQLESYVGLTPGESSSSDTKHRLGITKAGAKRLRWVLVQAAWSARRHAKADAMIQWAARVELRRGRFMATVALARKLVGILYAILRDGTTYDAHLGAKAV
jgi:transposase